MTKKSGPGVPTDPEAGEAKLEKSLSDWRHDLRDPIAKSIGYLGGLVLDEIDDTYKPGVQKLVVAIRSILEGIKGLTHETLGQFLAKYAQLREEVSAASQEIQQLMPADYSEEKYNKTPIGFLAEGLVFMANALEGLDEFYSTMEGHAEPLMPISVDEVRTSIRNMLRRNVSSHSKDPNFTDKRLSQNLEFDFTHGDIQTLTAYRTRLLNSILANIINNACNAFAKQDGQKLDAESGTQEGLMWLPHINVAISRGEAPGEDFTPLIPAAQPIENYALIRIEDNAGGIPQEAWDRFGEGFTTQEGEGHGIGLASLKADIEQHKGALWGKTETGIGTTYVIALPISQAAQPEEPQEPAQSDEAVEPEGTES